MIDMLTLVLGMFLFAYGVVVLYRMKATSHHLRGCGWVLVTTGAFGMALCGASRQSAAEYYLITIFGIAILCACGFRAGLSHKEACRDGSKI